MEERICMPSITYPARPPHYHGFCWGCCHPVSHCCCCTPQCRKEAKELVVAATAAATDKVDVTGVVSLARNTSGATDTPPPAKSDATPTPMMMTGAALGGMTINPSYERPTFERVGDAKDKAFIGGGCCVHLSVEYMPLTPNINSEAHVVVDVKDSEGTGMRWSQRTGPGSVYQVRENIITTKPGALLTVSVSSMIARVRWCEIFSC